MDSARSHVQGLLPYVVLDESGKPKVVYPNPEENDNDSNGNFKQYVCDFGKEIPNYDPCAELTEEEKVYGDKSGRIAGQEMVISNDEKKEPKHYLRFRYLDFSNAYHYAKKQIRDGILVKHIKEHDVLTKYDCDGNLVYEPKEVWTYKFDEIKELYDYVPCNFYGKDENGHRATPNFTKEGEYGFVWGNTNDEEKPKDEFILLVGVSMDENGTIYPNQDKVYGREDKDDPTTVYWEYPDTAGKINKDSERWIDFGLAFSKGPWSICKDMEEKFIGYLNIPQNIEGDYVPEKIAYSDIPKWQKWFEIHSSGSCCYEKIVGENEPSQIVDKEWTAMGGDEMKDFLKGKETLLNEAISTIKGLSGHFLVPNMEFPLLFTNEYRDTGLWTEYVDDDNPDGIEIKPKTRKECGSDAAIPETEPLVAKWIDTRDKGFLVESQLQLVRSEIYHSDDNGVLPGLFDEDGGYYKCYYRNYYEYREYLNPSDNEKENAFHMDSVPASATTEFEHYIISVGNIDEDMNYYKSQHIEQYYKDSISAPLECHDDYTAANNASCYFTATVTEEAIPILRTLIPLKEHRGLIDQDFVNLLAKYKSPLKIPYIKDEVHNFYEDENGDCYGDYVTGIQKSDDQITITYNIGGKCNSNGTPNKGENSGVILQDTYDYTANHSYNCSFEDYPTTINGEYIDFDKSAITATSDDLSTKVVDEKGNVTYASKERKCNQAKLLGFRSMDALNGLLPKVRFKQDIADGLNFPVESEVDIEINRGAASAFENYFKLAECNTFQDLENYQNNWFNL